MKSTIKIIALILILAMSLSLLYACKKDETADPGQKEPSAAPTSPAASAPAKEGGKPAEEEPEGFKLPIVDEPVEYTCWFIESPTIAGITTLSENKTYQEVERLTNIRMVYSHPANFGEGFAQFAMSIMSGDWYDTYISIFQTFTQGFDYYIDEGIFVDLNPYLDKYAPNYLRAANINDETLASLITDSGYMPGFWQLTPTVQPSFYGPMVRADWLDELGASMPQTYSELHDLLVRLKDAKPGVDAVMSIAVNGMSDWLMNGMGTQYYREKTYCFINKDGKVEFTASSDAMREYVTLMNQWYDEGLIDRDFYARDEELSSSNTYMPTDRVAVGANLCTNIDYFQNFKTDEDFRLEGIPFMKKNAGDKIHIYSATRQITNRKVFIGAITTTCEAPDNLFRWYDFFYSEEGALLANYGFEGETFEYVDGVPTFTELIYKDKENRSINTMEMIYVASAVQPMLYDYRRDMLVPGTSKEVMDACIRWDESADGAWSMPLVTLTSEESERFTAVFTDMDTYVNENIVKFIIGEKPLSEWDAYVAELERMGEQTVVDIMTAAVARCNNRLNIYKNQ